METAEIISHLRNLSDSATVAGLSDWAVKTLRAEGSNLGHSAADLLKLVAEEFRRIGGNQFDLDGYVQAPRVGSEFRLTRKARIAIFVHYKTRIAAGLPVA